MAKKGQQVQLQLDVSTDEEWEKLLERDGLIVVDVYSDWCGPCNAMGANLKRIKLEIGGDFLHLAMAKSDNIEALKRFVGKSEPTWMFIAKGQMVELLFGADAPTLQRAILDELRKEKECHAGKRDRLQRLPCEYSQAEKVVYDELIAQSLEREEKIKEKALKQLTERRMAQAKNILDSMSHVGVILLFPHAARKGPDAISDFWTASGLTVSKKDRPLLTQEAIDEIEFFSPWKLNEEARENLCSDKSLAMMITQEQVEGVGPIDDNVLRFAYGASKQPPGDKDTPAYVLQKRHETARSKMTIQISAVNIELPAIEDYMNESELLNEEEEDEELETSRTLSHFETQPPPSPPQSEEEEDKPALDGLWAPANELVKSTALKFFFPLITNALILPEPPPIPPHIAMCFDAFKRNDVLNLAGKEYQNEVMNYGFFTSEQPETAQLIASSKRTFEKTQATTQPTFGEKLVIKVSRRRSDTIFAFAQLGPTHMSANVIEGERECSLFFPEGYTQEDEKPEPEPEPKEKKTKKQSRHGSTKKTKEERKQSTEPHEPAEIVFEGVVEGAGADAEYVRDLPDDVSEIPPVMTELPEVEPSEPDDHAANAGGDTDKATSPMESPRTGTANTTN